MGTRPPNPPTCPAGSPKTPPRDRRIAEALLVWFEANRRDLPWRSDTPAGSRDPYRVLVSELMLQQTQVSRVIDRYDAFLARFPDVRSLARADLHDVLAAWAGLGYYRRARLLHAAARSIVETFGGRFPSGLEDIQSLPGVGRYTAGAVASIAFNQPAPIVDGNVARVLSRLDADAEGCVHSKVTWARSLALVQASAKGKAGAFNEAMMELGATVCTPRNPSCGACPLARECVARAQGEPDRYPTPKKSAARSKLHILSVVVRDARGRLLVERRPMAGLWGGLWQFPSVEAARKAPTRATLLKHLHLSSRPAMKRLGQVQAVLSHRDVTLVVCEAVLTPEERRAASRDRSWMSPSALASEGLSNTHAKALQLVLNHGTGPTIRRAALRPPRG